MKNRGFQYLWIGQSLANLGDVFYIVGLMTFLYGLTESAMYMALVPFISTVARFLSALMAPLVMEWMGLKRSLVISQACKTLLLLGFFGLTFYSLDSARVPIVFLVVVLVSFLDGWATPARGALVPVLVPEKKLIAKNSFLALMDQSMTMSGWALGGLFAAKWGSTSLIAVTLILYCTASLCMGLIRSPKKDLRKKSQGGQSKWSLLKNGWRTVWQTPVLRIIFLTESLWSFADVVWIAAIIYVFVDQALHVDASWWGYINFIFFVGLILTSFYGMRWSAHLKKHSAPFVTVGTLLGCIVTFLFGMNSLPWAALVLTLFYGIAFQFQSVIFLTIEQKTVSPNHLANVFAAQDAIQSILFGIGSLLLGYLADTLGVRSVFYISAALLFLAFLVLFTSRKHIVFKK
ncbi:MFS transporter [Sporolactobacillus sp. STCC-11]|uniref:MFS transporter n=1 Tax=Sporolactobacillus caesalpiniae TaxID=3230362 RepID=UPI003391440F